MPNVVVELGGGRLEVVTVEPRRPVSLEREPPSGRSVELTPGCLCTRAELLQFRGCTCAPRDEEPLG